MTGVTHRGMLISQHPPELIAMLIVRARRGGAAAGQAAGLSAEALLASWPFGSFGPSQKNREIDPLA